MSAFKLHVISCGHGDTLLLQMPKRKWALIDCHLPGQESRKKFFDLVESLRIRKLDYVVLTHPDSDHYKGMRQVLEHFTSNGRELGYFCAAGAPSHVLKLLESRGLSADDVKEYAALFRTVNELRERNLLRRHALHDQIATIRISGKRRGFSLVAVGPDYDKLASAQDAVLANLVHPAMNVNECSVVLVAQFVTLWASYRFLLPGDMEEDGLTKALERWDKHPDNIGSMRTFNLVKVPHHGSPNGHDPATVARKAPGGTVVISCGTSYGLPSRQVISDYLSAGWTVYCTSTRSAPPKVTSALQATSRTPAIKTSVSSHDICVVAGNLGWLRVTPSAARILPQHLSAYQ